MNAANKIVTELTQDLKNSTLPHPGTLYHDLCAVYPLTPIENKKHYDCALRVLTNISESMASASNRLLEKDLTAYAGTLGLLIENYEKAHYPNAGKVVSGVEMLAFLMEQHNLSQSDLSKELGGQPNVSAILAGKRSLNARQIETLAKRFNVSPASFFDT